MNELMREIIVTQEQHDMIVAMINSDIDRLQEMRESEEDEEYLLDMSAEIIKLKQLRDIVRF